MDKQDKFNDCCDGSSGCWTAGRIIGCILLAIVIFALIFWAGRVALNIAGSNYPLSGNLVSEIIIFLIAVWVISWFVRIPFNFMYGGRRSDIRILRKRYAKGEISEIQFKRMMKNLREH